MKCYVLTMYPLVSPDIPCFKKISPGITINYFALLSYNRKKKKKVKSGESKVISTNKV